MVASTPGANCSTQSAHYRAAWVAVESAGKAAFPRIEGEDGACFASSGACCAASGVNVTAAEAAEAGCFRVDRSNTYWTRGSRGAMCYACWCTREGLPASEDAYCTEYQQLALVLSLWKLFATAIVVVVNTVVKQALERIVAIEKHHESGAESGSVAIKVYCAQLINTALLLLILSADVPALKLIPTRKFAQINSEWYAVVLAPLASTMIIQFLTPPSMHLLSVFLVSKLKRKLSAKKMHTQNALNGLFEPVPLRLAGSYGEVLLSMSVTLLYTAAMPILYWIGAVGFSLKYWADN